MATGDAAAAAGLYVVPPTKDARLGYDDINRRGDELANHIVNGHHKFDHIDGTTTEAQIGNNTISTVKLKDGNVTTAKIANLAITTALLADLSVSTGKIIAKAVTTAKINDSAITATQLATDAVITAKIKDAAVTNAKLGAAAVDGAKLNATLSKSGTWNIEATSLVLRDITNTDKLTLGDGFRLVSNQEATVDASTLHLDADFSVMVDAGADFTVDADAQVSIKSGHAMTLDSDEAIVIDAGDGVTISSGTGHGILVDSAEAVTITSAAGNNILVDAAGALLLKGHGAELTLSDDVDGARVYSPTIYSRTYSNPANVFITSAGTLGRSTSSRRYKVDIVDAEPMPSVLEIVPRNWADKNDPGRSRQFGAIAEELDDLGLTDLVVYNPDGTPEAIAYDRVAIALIPIIKDLAQRLAALEGGGN